MDNKVLGIGHDAACRQAAPIAELVCRELRNVHAVKVDLPHRAIGQHPIGGRHVSRGNAVQHGRHADNRGRAAKLLPHGVLRRIDVAITPVS